MAKTVDTMTEIERAYIKDQITYQRIKPDAKDKTTYSYSIAIPNEAVIENGKLGVVLIYPFNYNATPDVTKPFFNISWGDGKKTRVAGNRVNMFSLCFDKIKPLLTEGKDTLLEDLMIHPVEGKPYGGSVKLYHEYEVENHKFKVNNENYIEINIDSNEIVVPVALNISRVKNLVDFVDDVGNFEENVVPSAELFASHERTVRGNFFQEIMFKSILQIAVVAKGKYPSNEIGKPTEKYRSAFSDVFKRGIYHPLDQKISHIKSGEEGIDSFIKTNYRTSDKSFTVDYKSPTSMSMYALAGNNRFVNKELLDSIGTENEHPIPIQAYLCSGVYDTDDDTYKKARVSRGININPMITPALINKGVHINNSIIRYSLITKNSDKSTVKIHSVFNPFQSIASLESNKMLSNLKCTEIWGFFCGLFRNWRYDYHDSNRNYSPWYKSYGYTYNSKGTYEMSLLLSSIPETVKSMKCIFRVHQNTTRGDYNYCVRSNDRLLDLLPTSVEEVENLVVFSNIEMLSRHSLHVNYNFVANIGFNVSMLNNTKYIGDLYFKYTNLRVVKNLIFCCDLYPEYYKVTVKDGKNEYEMRASNLDGVKVLSGFNNLETVDGVFTYCRVDNAYIRIRDICLRPEKDLYNKHKDKIKFKQIDLSRVIHWCDCLNYTNDKKSWFDTSYIGSKKDIEPYTCNNLAFGLCRNEYDFKNMGLSFMFIEKYDRSQDYYISGNYIHDNVEDVFNIGFRGYELDQTPIFKSVKDFAHGYMMTYTQIKSNNDIITVRIDGYIQQLKNDYYLFKERYRNSTEIDKKGFNQYFYYIMLNNFIWNTPLGWMHLSNTLNTSNIEIEEKVKNGINNFFKPTITDLCNIEGLFANVGPLSCDLVPLNELHDEHFNNKGKLDVIEIDSSGLEVIRQKVMTSPLKFGLYTNDSDVIIKTKKDINISRLFQNELYYGALATDNFYQARSKYLNWFTDLNIYRDNLLNKLDGLEHNLAYNMTTFKEYENLKGNDYKDRIISMGIPMISDKNTPYWRTPDNNLNILKNMSVFHSTKALFLPNGNLTKEDNILNWIFPPLISGFRFRYPSSQEFNFKKQNKMTLFNYTMNTQYPRVHQGTNFVAIRGKFIVNEENSSTNADYAFDGVMLYNGLDKSIVHKDVKFSSIKGITTKNTIGVIKHNCDWNFKDENVIAYIPTISRPFNTVVVGEPFTNLKHIIPKKIVPNEDELNECVALRMNEFNTRVKYPNRVNAMIVPKVATTPARYRKFDNIQYKFKGKDSVEFDEFDYMPHNIVDWSCVIPVNSKSTVFGVSHVRKLFPDDVDVHIKNFKMPYLDKLDKFKILYDKSKPYKEFEFTKDSFIYQGVPLKYALNGARVDNLEEVKSKWNYKGTPIIFKSSRLIYGPLNSEAKGYLRCAYKNINLKTTPYNLKIFIICDADWENKYKIYERNIMLENGKGNNDKILAQEASKAANSNRTFNYSFSPVNCFQPPLWHIKRLQDLSNDKLYYDKKDTSAFTNWSMFKENIYATSGYPYNLLPTEKSNDWLPHISKRTIHNYRFNDITDERDEVLDALPINVGAFDVIDENAGGSARYVSQLPKEMIECLDIIKHEDRIEFNFKRNDIDFSIMVLSDIPLWLEGSDYITGEFPPYSDYSEKYPAFKTKIDEAWFRDKCFNNQMIGFEIDDVFLEVDDHFRLTSALMQIDNNDLSRPHRVNPYILEPTTYKGQTKFGEVINAYGRKFPIVNFRWTLGFAFSNLPKTVTEVEGFNFADTVYVPDKCIPEQITKFHFHNEFLKPNNTYKRGIIDCVLWFNEPFMNKNVEMVGVEDYFKEIMLFTRRKDNLSGGVRTQMEEYYEWSTDNKINFGPVNYVENNTNSKYCIDARPPIGYNVYNNDIIHHAFLGVGPTEPDIYEMRRNFSRWCVADRNTKSDDIITVKWVVRFQNKIELNAEDSSSIKNFQSKTILNPHISSGFTKYISSEDVIIYTGKAKDLINFKVFDLSNIKNAVNLEHTLSTPTIKSIRIYSEVYVCPAFNWERGMWGVLRGTLPAGTDTRCVPIPQRCTEGIFYRDVKLHGIITGEYDGSLPEKLFWGTRNKNLRIQGLYCSTKYANPNIFAHKRKNKLNLLSNIFREKRSSTWYSNTFAPPSDDIRNVCNFRFEDGRGYDYFKNNYSRSVYNIILGNNLNAQHKDFNSNKYFPIIGVESKGYNDNLILDINKIPSSDIETKNTRVTLHYWKDILAYSIHQFSAFYAVEEKYNFGVSDKLNYVMYWDKKLFNIPKDVDDMFLNTPNEPHVRLTNNLETTYNYQSREVYSNVHDVSPLSIPHKIDELDVSNLGGFGDLKDVYTKDPFGITFATNIYEYNYPNPTYVHQELYEYIDGMFNHNADINDFLLNLTEHNFKEGDITRHPKKALGEVFGDYKLFRNGAYEKYFKDGYSIKNSSNLYNSYPRPNAPTVPITSFFGKWFFLNGVIKTDEDAYVFSDLRTGYLRERDQYSPHRFTQVEFDQSIYAVQSDYVKRSDIYRVSHLNTTDIHSALIDKENYITSALTHGGFNCIERYSRSSIYFPSTLISETVGNIRETGYAPIMCSLGKLVMQKIFKDSINASATYDFSPIPMEALMPQGYMANWAVADEETMTCGTLHYPKKATENYPNHTIMQAPKWYSDDLGDSIAKRYTKQFKYQDAIRNDLKLMTAVVALEPSKNMIFRMNGKREISARYGRMRVLDIGKASHWLDAKSDGEYDVVYQRMIPGVAQPMMYKNSHFSHRGQCMRNLTHWHCNGFNYGLIDDTGMTQYLDISRELFIEGEAGYSINQSLIGCHPHLKWVRITNGAATEISKDYAKEYGISLDKWRQNEYHKTVVDGKVTYDNNYDNKTYYEETEDSIELPIESQFPSFNQTSRNAIIKEILPYQPCLTFITNASSSSLQLTVGQTSLEQIYNVCHGIKHGAKYGVDKDRWIWVMGEEQKLNTTFNNMRTAIIPTRRSGCYTEPQNSKPEPIKEDITSYYSSYVDVINDNKWVYRKEECFAPGSPVKVSRIGVYGTYKGIEMNPYRRYGLEPNTTTPDGYSSEARYFDTDIVGKTENKGQVNYGRDKGKELSVKFYDANRIYKDIKRIKESNPLNLELIEKPMRWWGMNNDEWHKVNVGMLYQQMGLIRNPKDLLGNIVISQDVNKHLKVYCSNIFDRFAISTFNLTDLVSLYDESIDSIGVFNNVVSNGDLDKIILYKDNSRFSNLKAQKDTITYGKHHFGDNLGKNPRTYCYEQRYWFSNTNGILSIDFFDAIANKKYSDYTSSLLVINEPVCDLTGFYKGLPSDFIKASYYSNYNSVDESISAFENSLIKFPSLHMGSFHLNVNNMFKGLFIKWNKNDLKLDVFQTGVNDVYKISTPEYVKSWEFAKKLIENRAKKHASAGGTVSITLYDKKEDKELGIRSIEIIYSPSLTPGMTIEDDD